MIHECFKDFPIEFKKINPEDFESFNVEEKVIISPNGDGYISEELHSKISLEDKNTVVINAAVGQGKTFSIIEIVKQYFEATEDYMIFIASPFVSLVEQYYLKTIDVGIPKEQVYRYDWINDPDSPSYINKKIHIVTANLLLGNPGEEGIINSDAKREYVNTLISLCIAYNRKAVFIYDEIHDTIHNFKEELIFNLWKWKDVIHKNFVISATFNEASKIVIEYLAELTDKKIQIIESERKRFPEKQSELYLHFNEAKNYLYKDDGITTLIRDLVAKGKNIDILSYSKKLAEDIDKNMEGIGGILRERFSDINLCTSATNIKINNRYNAEKCNVGTNFKSGVSIEKENHAFVIIMPPNGAKKSFNKKFGIFSDGINSVIQVLARQRKKGEIHIILPLPEIFDFDSLPFETDECKKIFQSFYERYQRKQDNVPVKYLSINEQDRLIKEFYDEIYTNVRAEVEYIRGIDRGNLATLSFPHYKNYKLSKGEKYLVNKCKFFGGDLSAYILYCAITNQFINCKLANIETKSIKNFYTDSIQQGLEDFYTNYMNDYGGIEEYINDTAFYNNFHRELFNDYLVYIDGKSIKSNINKKIEKQILGFIQRKLYPHNEEFNRRFFDETGRLKDEEYTRTDYLLSCIAHSLDKDTKSIEKEEKITESNIKDRVTAFKNMHHFRQRLIDISNSKTARIKGEFNYLEKKSSADFIRNEEDMEKFNQIKRELQRDIFIENGIFEFKKSVINKETTKSIESFYRVLVETFFEVKDQRLSIEPRNMVNRIISIKDIPFKEDVLNLISPSRLKDWLYTDGVEDIFSEP